ncbi:MAG: hypothetical protein Q4P78_04220 [Rothia sp. (in: high G+C Gram-positive bacteria)]|uniref:hypothetical protein n=1 Tax=Rothia sp. (in: high G+C Gram-positive bacteria) TaxID=1885016 RepID=UPI0026DFA373|nr:hypothetical protein [Rothia sp. (in: high G+C Gram-positive bacteria)]MDO5750395.1 hypothetical protein [Rothia sp. (in: high G+C Gram-positive bacteria)]
MPGISSRISRRQMTQALWAAPVIAASAAVPAYAASATGENYGQIIVLPRASKAADQKFNGTKAATYTWIMYPTSNLGNGTADMQYTNASSTASMGYHDPADTPAGAVFPPVYPANAPKEVMGFNGGADFSSVDGVDGVGQGARFHITIENIAGDVVYAPTPTGTTLGSAKVVVGGGDAIRNNKMTTATGYKGKGANPPVVQLEPGYISPTVHGYGRYLNFEGYTAAKNSDGLYGYGTHYTTATGRDGWSWDVELKSNITSVEAGISNHGIQIMTYLRPTSYGDAAKAKATNIPVQYRVTITSPWGTVSYTSDPV